MNYQKELLIEVVDKWTVPTIDNYIDELKERREQLDSWIRTVQTVRRKKMREKTTPENGPRDGR